MTKKTNIFILACLFLRLNIVAHEGGDQALAQGESKSLSSTEGCPSGVVHNSVCVISGDFSYSTSDLTLQGPEPLSFDRFYSSGATGGSLRGSWSHNHLDSIKASNGDYFGEKILFSMVSRGFGSTVMYKYPMKGSRKLDILKFEEINTRGVVNQANTLCGRTRVSNQQVLYDRENKKFYVTSSEGYKNEFKYACRVGCYDVHLSKEQVRLNGHSFLYSPNNQKNVKRLVFTGKVEAVNNKTQKKYSSIRFSQSHQTVGDIITVLLKTSIGQNYRYLFTKQGEQHLLTKFESRYRPHEDYEYEAKSKMEGQHIVKISKPEKRFLETRYYHSGVNHIGGDIGSVHVEKENDVRINRVKMLLAPVGTTSKSIPIYRFVYHVKQKKVELGICTYEGMTEVYDAIWQKTTYEYDKRHRLGKIVKFDGMKNYVEYASERFVWGPSKTPLEGNLYARVLRNGNKSIHHARCYEYDKRGNLSKSILIGPLTGHHCPQVKFDNKGHIVQNGFEQDITSYAYTQDGLNLLKSETTSSGVQTLNEYLPNTALITSKCIHYDGRIQAREFYFYGENQVVIKTISDNGSSPNHNDFSNVTQRLLTYFRPTTTVPIGLPESIEERYLDLNTGQEVSLKRTLNEYSKTGNITKQSIYDCHGAFCYSLEWEYDDHGNEIQHVNALGEVVLKAYDQNDNLIRQEDLASGLIKSFTYDYSNRLIREEEHHPNGNHLVTTNRYDILNRKLASVNPYGQETRFYYDGFERVTEVHLPSIPNEEGQIVQPIIRNEYDIVGNLISHADATGKTTKSKFNIRGLPIEVIFPNGTVEKLFYRTDGCLVDKVDRSGVRISYILDPLGRTIEEHVFGSDGAHVKKKMSIYSAQQLLKIIDFEGLETSFSYDFAGRLVKCTSGESVKELFYDSLGRVCETREWYGDSPKEYSSLIQIYDSLNRVTEERRVGGDGIIYQSKKIAYDSLGNKTFEQIGDQKTFTEYDVNSNPVKITNALGEVTHVSYDKTCINEYGQRVLRTVTTDAMGFQTVDTYDTSKRLVDCFRLNPFGVKVSQEKIYYDLSGNKRKVINSVFHGDKEVSKIETHFHYNLNHDLITVVEAVGTKEQKTSHTEYSSVGLKTIEQQPNGAILRYHYDNINRLREIRSNDNTIFYFFSYNLNDKVVKIFDAHNNTDSDKIYDNMGRLTQDKLASGITCNYAYDKAGRMIRADFPDGISVNYHYGPFYLNSIERIENDRVLYRYQETNHTLQGMITQSILPGNNGSITYDYDLLNRCVGIHSPTHEQNVPKEGYDPAGKLLNYTVDDKPFNFKYDDLCQLTYESGNQTHTYKYDSLSNRIEKDGVSHEINALNQLKARGKDQFDYDANGNMIKQVIGEKVTEYSYDSLDRLIKIVADGQEITYKYDPFNRRISKTCKGEDPQYFFYYGGEEIGSIKNGKAVEFKLLTPSIRGGAIAIELNRQVFVPQSDLFGHVVSIRTLDGKMVEKYHYTAFGEVTIVDINNEQIRQSSIGNPWRYANKRFDPESGLYAFGLRYYQPDLGRWITEDPAGLTDGPNLYAYVHNTPLLYTDPLGLTGEAFNSGPGFKQTLATTFTPILQKLNFLHWGPLFPGGTPGTVTYDGYDERFAKYATTIDEARSGPCKLRDRTKFVFANRSECMDLGTEISQYLPEGQRIKTVFLNGIGNTRQEWINSAKHLYSLVGMNIGGVYAASYGFLRDIIRFNMMKFNLVSSFTEYLLKRKLTRILTENPLDILAVICHSCGSVRLSHVLDQLSAELKARIFVIAVAPGKAIRQDQCGGVVNMYSNADFVVLAPHDIDVPGRYGTVVKLDPHPQASFPDHSVTSPTYSDAIRMSYKSILKKTGRYGI